MISKLLTTAATLAGVARAATAVSDEQMTNWLNGDGVELANAYAPIYFFGQAMNQPPCIPTWAFGGNPDTPDVFDPANQTPGGAACEYPDVGCNCRNPGVDIGNPAPAFPIYYSVRRCNDTEVRVAYNLFYEKDGATVGPIETGHEYDWERVVIRHGRGSDGQWTPQEMLGSAHDGYKRYLWGDIQNTLTSEEIAAGANREPNGVQGNDHPKVYVAWSKHPNFHDRNTGWNDPISQSTDNAFRSQDWWYYVDPQYYIRSDGETDAGRALAAADWGSASSDPPSVHDGLCDV